MKALIKHFSVGYKFFLLLILIFSSNYSSAVTWYVSKLGNDTLNGLYPTFTAGYDGPKATISSALALANTGDTIQIAKGVYTENVVVTKDIYMNADSVTLSDLKVNSPAIYCLLMGTYLDISDTLSLDNGILYINSSKFMLRTLIGSTLMGGSKQSYIEGGRFYRQLDGGTGRFLYPLGAAGEYRPAYMSYHQQPGDDRFHYMQMFDKPAPYVNQLPSGIRNISTTRYWDFGRVGSGLPTDYVLEIGYDSSLVDDHVYDQANLRLMFHHDVNKGWIDLKGNGDQPRLGLLKAGLAADTVGILTYGNIEGGFNPIGTDLPFARFAYTGACAKSTFNFLDRSKNLPNPKIVQWNWNFGVADSTSDTSSLKNPSYTYVTPGNYTVKLVVTNDSGDLDSFENKITVWELPKVKFSASTECLNDFTKFVDSSKVTAPDSIFTRAWKLGDGFTASTKKFQHTFGNFGTFSVKLVATTAKGCRDSATGIATVRNLPKLNFTTKNVCSNDTAVYKRIKGLDPNDSKFTYSWNIDNATVGGDTIQKFRYNNAGVHKVVLIASDQYGCIDLVLKNDTSFGLPKISFYLDKSIAGNDSLQCKTTNKFTFKNKITTTQGQTYVGGWKFGDGATGLQIDSFHSYADTGKYKVKLLAQTNRGCRDSVTKTYVVRGLIRPVIAKIGICAPDSVTLYDSATVTTSPVTQWNWTLPGGVTATGKNIRVWNKFPTPGLVKLVVTNSEGCMDSVSKAFSYTLYPIITMITSGSIPFCPGDSLVVTSLFGGTNYKWLKDGDTTSTNKSFKAAGLYPLQAFNGPFCSKIDSTLIITVKTAANIVAYSDTSVQRGSSAVLRATGGTSYTWTPNTYLNKNTGSTVISTPTNTQKYVVTGTNASGCKGTDTVTVTLLEPLYVRIPNIITPNGDGENDAWVLSDIKNLDLFEVTITDYAGKIVYTSAAYKNDWNGTKDGKELPEGIFYYKLKNRSTGETIKGFIQVIR